MADDAVTVWRHRGGVLQVRLRRELFNSSGSIRCLTIQTGWAFAVGGEDEMFAIGRPHRGRVGTGTASQFSERPLPSQIQDPDVVFLIANFERELRPIR